MIRFSRCAGGPVTWIGWTFGAGSGSGGGGPCAFAVAAPTPSSTTAATRLFTLRLIDTPSSQHPETAGRKPADIPLVAHANREARANASDK